MVCAVGTGGYFAWKEAVERVNDDVARIFQDPFRFIPNLKLLRESFDNCGLNNETRDRPTVKSGV
jgi:hypothetical protein